MDATAYRTLSPCSPSGREAESPPWCGRSGTHLLATPILIKRRSHAAEIPLQFHPCCLPFVACRPRHSPQRAALQPAELRLPVLVRRAAQHRLPGTGCRLGRGLGLGLGRAAELTHGHLIRAPWTSAPHTVAGKAGPRRSNMFIIRTAE
jgi:hypothetical protein